jgi:hypothetical protein
MWLRNISRVFPFRRVRDCILWWGGGLQVQAAEEGSTWANVYCDEAC